MLCRKHPLLKPSTFSVAPFTVLPFIPPVSSPIDITYPDLPVSQRREEIIKTLTDNQVIVIVGDTGSGKTTQLPKMALQWMRDAGVTKGRIGCTQPRRIAASSVAKRVAEELKTELGDRVGYQVRFRDHSQKDTPIKFMTDGILLAETQGDPKLRQYSCLIIDEAHERSLNIDFILGYLRELLPTRPDLKIIISSATLDADRFSEFFYDAPIIEVEGRTFPVTDEFLPEEEGEDLRQHVLRGVKWINRYDQQGDVLIFLPGEREIRMCANILEEQQWNNVDVLPLYARLSLADQQRVFSTSNNRRIILATNVAETSLTIPGIVYVLDAGIVRMSRYLPARGIQRLQDERVSQASARQRRGRCGRVREGLCLKLYSEDEYNSFPEFTDPEIKRSSLAGVILRMKSLKLPSIREFSFLDPPSSKAIREGESTLEEIGALDEIGNLTEIGFALARLPLDPRLGRMLLEGHERGVASALTTIIAGLSVMDVRERPTDKQGAADTAHQKFKHPDSDFLSLLEVWTRLQEFRQPSNGNKRPSWQKNQLRRYCQKNFLSFRRVLEWDQVIDELRQLQKEQLKLKVPALGTDRNEWGHFDNIHKALLTGIPMQIGHWDKEKRYYKSTNNRSYSVFPGSCLFGKQYPEWVMGHEIVETSKVFARKVAKIDPTWLEELVPWACRYKHHSPYWNAQQGTVYGKENVLLSGLLLAYDRDKYFGKVNPKDSHLIFVAEAIVAGVPPHPFYETIDTGGTEWQAPLRGKMEFLDEFHAIKTEILLLEHKLRKVGHLWQEKAAVDFFFERVPGEIHSAKEFHLWRKKDGNEQKLMPRLADLIWQEPEGAELFPNLISHEEENYNVYYRTEIGARDDGVVIGIHIDQLEHFPDHLLSWGIPGLYAERAETMIRSLQKDFRTACQPVKDTAWDFASEWLEWQPNIRMEAALAEFLAKRTGFDQLTLEDMLGVNWDAARTLHDNRMPEEWRPKVWIFDDANEELAFGTDLTKIRIDLAELLAARRQEEANALWHMTGATMWDFGQIDELPLESNGCYPALVDEKTSIGLQAFLTPAQAEASHRAGCIRLFRLHYPERVEYLEKNLPLDPMVKLSLGIITQEQGTFLSDLISTSIEHALGDPLPRSANEFEVAAERARGELHNSALEISDSFARLIESKQEVTRWCEENARHRYHSEIALDISEQTEFLLQRFMLKQFTATRISQLYKHFYGMEERIEKIAQQPFVREEERMNLFTPLWLAWFNAWKESKLPRKHDLQKVGELIEDWRMHLFAPGSPKINNSKISKKTIESALSEIGIPLP